MAGRRERILYFGVATCKDLAPLLWRGVGERPNKAMKSFNYFFKTISFNPLNDDVFVKITKRQHGYF
jgi:hypothetical protein